MFCPVMPKPSKTWAPDICWPSVTSLLSTVNEGTDGMKSYGNGGRSVMAHLRQYRGRLARHAYVIHGRARHGGKPLSQSAEHPGFSQEVTLRLSTVGRAVAPPRHRLIRWHRHRRRWRGSAAAPSAH